MTPAVLLTALNFKHLSAPRLNVIVFDECHRGVDDHPYRQIMERVFESTTDTPGNRPRVLGLTASLVNKGRCKRKPDKDKILEDVESQLLRLAKTYQAAIVGPNEVSDSSRFG